MLKKIEKLKKILVKDPNFYEVLRGSVFTIISRVLSVVLSLLASIIVARFYGAKETGILAIVQTLMTILCIFAVFGINISILRMIPEHIAKYSLESAFYVFKKIIYIVVILSAVIGILVIFFSEKTFVFLNYDQIIKYALPIGCLLVFRALTDVSTQVLRSLKLMKLFSFMLFFPNLSFLILLVGFLIFSRNEGDPVYSQLFSWIVAALIGMLFIYKYFLENTNKGVSFSKVSNKEILLLSYPMLMTASLTFFMSQVGILILGIYENKSVVGYYSIAVKLSVLTSFILQAINTMAAPKFSELYFSGKKDDLLSLAKKSSKLIFWSTLPILIGLVLFGKFVLSLYGPEFIFGYIPMLILIIGQFFNSISGPTGHFMNMTGSHHAFKNIVIVSAFVNISSCFILIPKYGEYGAALATSLTLILWNISSLVYIKNKYKKSIIYVPFFS